MGSVCSIRCAYYYGLSFLVGKCCGKDILQWSKSLSTKLIAKMYKHFKVESLLRTVLLSRSYGLMAHQGLVSIWFEILSLILHVQPAYSAPVVPGASEWSITPLLCPTIYSCVY